MNIGWPRTFGLDLDLVRRALPFYHQYPNAGRIEVETHLGIGGQKVQGLNSWLKYLQLRNSRTGDLLPLGILLLQADPDLSDRATLCVLHYILVSNPEATVWYEAVNHFLPGREFFTADNLRVYFEQAGFGGNSFKQLTSDRGLFLSTYTGQERRALQDLNLLRLDGNGYSVRSVSDVPPFALGYCLYDRRSQHNNETTTEIRRLLNEERSPGVIFGMPEEALRQALASLESAGLISVIRVADIDGIAFAHNLNPLALLERHFELH
jgi:hypothetical protein